MWLEKKLLSMLIDLSLVYTGVTWPIMFKRLELIILFNGITRLWYYILLLLKLVNYNVIISRQKLLNPVKLNGQYSSMKFRNIWHWVFRLYSNSQSVSHDVTHGLVRERNFQTLVCVSTSMKHGVASPSPVIECANVSHDLISYYFDDVNNM